MARQLLKETETPALHRDKTHTGESRRKEPWHWREIWLQVVAEDRRRESRTECETTNLIRATTFSFVPSPLVVANQVRRYAAR